MAATRDTAYASLNQESQHGGAITIEDKNDENSNGDGDDAESGAARSKTMSPLEYDGCEAHKSCDAYSVESGTKHGGEDEKEGDNVNLSEDSSTIERLFVLIKQSFPVMSSFLLANTGQFINLMFAGHYVYSNGDKSIVFAGISLANMFANVTCQSLIVGMSGAIETLGSQNNGAGRYKEVGYILQRAYCIISCFAGPFMLLWYFSGDFFRMLGIDPDVCDVISAYLRVRMLCIPLDVFNISYEKYLMAIGVVKPSMYAFMAFDTGLLCIDLLFVVVLKLPYICLAWGWVIAAYCGAFMQRYTSRNHPSVLRTIQPWDFPQARTKWKEFIQLGLPGTVMLCAEWWAFEILTIFASFLGTEAVAAQSVIVSCAALVFMIPLGIGIATASLVGNALGAGRRGLAIEVAKLSLYFTAVIDTFVAIIVYFGAPLFMSLFTNDKDVLAVTDKMVPFLTIFVFTDGLQGVTAGVLRGCGKQAVAACSNVFSFYAIGLPMAWYLTFHTHFGVMGLMMGIACGTLFQDVVALSLVFVFESYTFTSNLSSSDGNKIVEDGSVNIIEQGNGTAVVQTPTNASKDSQKYSKSSPSFASVTNPIAKVGNFSVFSLEGDDDSDDGFTEYDV